jgi:hypothetical protein
LVTQQVVALVLPDAFGLFQLSKDETRLKNHFHFFGLFIQSLNSTNGIVRQTH